MLIYRMMSERLQVSNTIPDFITWSRELLQYERALIEKEITNRSLSGSNHKLQRYGKLIDYTNFTLVSCLYHEESIDCVGKIYSAIDPNGNQKYLVYVSSGMFLQSTGFNPEEFKTPERNKFFLLYGASEINFYKPILGVNGVISEPVDLERGAYNG